MKNAMSVLLIDDEPTLRGATAMLLSKRGAEVSMASSIEEAVEHAATRVFDVVVIDVSSPSPRASEILAALRTRALLPRRVVLCVKEPTRAREGLAGEELIKPFDFDQLIALVFGAEEGRRRTASGVFPQVRAKVIPLSRRRRAPRPARPRVVRARRAPG